MITVSCRFAEATEPRMELGRELRHRAECRRQKGLERLMKNPEELLARPHEAFSLLMAAARGGDGGGVTRAEFCEVRALSFSVCFPDLI